MRTIMNDRELMHRRRWATLAVLCLSLMVIGLDNTILNVALPTLGRQLHASTSSLQWIVDIYTLVFAGLLLSAGSLGDRFGRYKTLALGLAIFGLGSLASALSGSTHLLIAARAFMGIGGAFIMPSTLSIITNVFTDPVERGKAIGIWAGVAALGIGIGPVAGGFLLSHFYWGSVFFVNLPIVAAALIAGWFFVPDSRDPTAPRLDPLGALLSIVGLAAVLWAVIEAPVKGWGSTSTIIGLVAGAVVLAAFVWWELHFSSPMLDMRFFENPRFTAASMAIALTFFSLFGSLFLLTQYLQSVHGYSPLKAGAILIPQAAVLMVVAFASAGLVQRLGNKVVVGFGLVVVAVSLAAFAFLSANASLWEIIGVTILMAIGMGNVMAPATDSIMGSLPRAKAGVGSAMNDTTRQTGGAFGVAVLGSILASKYRATIAAEGSSHHLPAAVVSGIRSDVGTALRLAQTPVGAPYAATIGAIARHSFVTSFHLASLVGAVVLLLAALGVFAWLPARASDDPRPPRSPSRPGRSTPGEATAASAPTVATPASATAAVGAAGAAKATDGAADGPFAPAVEVPSGSNGGPPVPDGSGVSAVEVPSGSNGGAPVAPDDSVPVTEGERP
jgi:EmrB/QacA subfamily drug resistance transporter